MCEWALNRVRWQCSWLLSVWSGSGVWGRSCGVWSRPYSSTSGSGVWWRTSGVWGTPTGRGSGVLTRRSWPSGVTRISTDWCCWLLAIGSRWTCMREEQETMKSLHVVCTFNGALYPKTYCTVEPTNNGHVGTKHFVFYRDYLPYLFGTPNPYQRFYCTPHSDVNPYYIPPVGGADMKIVLCLWRSGGGFGRILCAFMKDVSCSGISASVSRACIRDTLILTMSSYTQLIIQ